MCVPPAPAPPAAPHAGAAPAGGRDPPDASTTSIAPLFVREGIDEPQPIASLPGRRAAHPRVAPQGGARARRPRRARRVILFGVPEHKDAEGSRRLGPRRHRAGRAARPARRGRRRRRADGRPLPRRVHRPRPLRPAHRRRARSTTTPPSSATPRSRSRRPTPAPTSSRRRGMMDGQVARHPRRARRRRPRPTSRSSPTRPSTRRRSTARSATRSTSTIAGGGDRKGYQQDPAQRPRGARRDPRSTSPRAPTW